MKVHSSIIHNGQKVETTRTCIVDKQHAVYAYTGILIIKRNEVLIHAITCMNLENIMLRRQAQKGHLIYALIYMKFSEEENP